MANLEDEFGDIIRKARRGLSIETAHLADATGITEERLRHFEDYEASPADGEVRALAWALSLNPTALLAVTKHWMPQPIDLAGIPGVTIERIPVPYGSYGSNAYILGDLKLGKAAILDPGGAVEEILQRIAASQFDPILVLVTHGDGDHVGGLADLIARTGVKQVFAHSRESLPIPHQAKQDGEEFTIGKVPVRMIHTPGHTPGSASYLAGSVCFTGDTLFAGSLGGATRYPEGYRHILSSAEKLLSLPEETILLPGHGPPTTVREEREHNPFFTGFQH